MRSLIGIIAFIALCSIVKAYPDQGVSPVPKFVGDYPKDIECHPDKPEYWKFMGKAVYTLTEPGKEISFAHNCFQKNKASYIWKSDDEIEVTIKSREGATWTCSDTVMITDLVYHKRMTSFKRGSHTMTYKVEDEDHKNLIKNEGIYIILMCDTWIHQIPDIIRTIEFMKSSFIKDPTPEQKEKLVEQGWDQLSSVTGFPKTERVVQIETKSDWLQKNVESGDSYCVFAGSGMDDLIGWNTGSVCSHSGMFLWGVGSDSSTLYYVESQFGDGGQHKGLVTEWDTDVTSARVLLKLNDENRAKFDVNKAWEFFNSIENFPYGMENILFSFLDTREGNTMQIASIESFIVVAQIMDHIKPTIPYFDTFIGESVNKRLGTTGLDLTGLVYEADRQGTTIVDVLLIPEPEGIVYGTGDKATVRYICSALVTAIYERAGVLGGITVLPNEFTPKDVFQLKIWQ